MAKVSFNQVLKDLNIHLDGASEAAPSFAPLSVSPDTLELSIQGQNALPVGGASAHSRQTRGFTESDTCAAPLVDSQGNQVRISSAGTALSQPEAVAWETGRTPGQGTAPELWQGSTLPCVPES